MRLKTAILLFLLSIPAAGQMPHPTSGPFSLFDARKDFQLDFSRLRTVDSGGHGNFLDLSSALAYVAALKDGSSGNSCTTNPATCRNADNPWVIQIEMGIGGSTDPTDIYTTPYNETRVTVPDFVTIQGVTLQHNSPVFNLNSSPAITLGATSGCLITLGNGSFISNLQLFWAGTPTGQVKGICYEGSSSPGVATNVSLSLLALAAGTSACGTSGRGAGSSPCAVDGVVIDGTGGFYGYNVSPVIQGNLLGSVVLGNAASNGASFYGGRFSQDSSCVALVKNIGAGDLSFYWSRFDPGCLLDMANPSGTMSQVGTPYGPSSGVITNKGIAAPFGTTNPATCSPGQPFVNTGSTKKHCDCISANTWACVTIL